MSGPIVYDPQLSRVRLTVGGLADGFPVRVQRSTDQVRWVTVRGGNAVVPSGGEIRLSDYEFAADVANWYRVVGPSAADGFGRTVADGWGTPDVGPEWVVTGTASQYSVDGAKAVHTHTSRGVTLESRQDITLADVDVTLLGITLSAAPTGPDSNTIVTLAARQVVNDRVEARLFYNTDGSVSVNVRQVVGGVETVSAFVPVAGATTTSTLSLRLQATGTSLSATAWLGTGLPPATPTVSMTTTWTTAGLLRVRSVLAAGTTNILPVTFTYEAFAVTSPEAALFTGSTVPTLDRVWLKSLARPFLNRPVEVKDFSDVSRPARGGVFEVVGRSYPVAVTDVRSSRRWTLEVNTYTPDEAQDLDLLLAAGDILLVHVPQNAGRLSAVPGGYVTVGDTRVVTPPTFDLRMRVFELPCVEVAAPGPDVIGSTATCQTVLNTYATCQAVLDAHPTCLDLLELVGDPTDVLVP